MIATISIYGSSLILGEYASAFIFIAMMMFVLAFTEDTTNKDFSEIVAFFAFAKLLVIGVVTLILMFWVPGAAVLFSTKTLAVAFIVTIAAFVTQWIQVKLRLWTQSHPMYSVVGYFIDCTNALLFLISVIAFLMP